jgi:hypothetical protein
MSELRNHIAARWDPDLAFRHAGLETPFARGITFGDVDLETEANGHFLTIEGKRTDEELSAGQVYTMDARVRDGRTVLVIYGDPPISIRFMRVWGGERSPADIAAFWNFVHRWFVWAERTPRSVSQENAFMRSEKAPRPVRPQRPRCPAVLSGQQCLKPAGHDWGHESKTDVWPQERAS